LAGQHHALDQHLAPLGIDDRDGVDADACGRQSAGLFGGIAQVLVAVAQENHPFGGVFGKGGLGQLEGIGQVGIIGIQLAFHAHQRHGFIEGRNFDGCLASKDDHSRVVFLAAVPGDLSIHIVQHGPPLVLGNALRLIEQIEHRHPVRGLHHLHLGHGQDQTQQHQAAQHQHPICPPSAQDSQPAHTPDPDQRQQYHRGQQPPGRPEPESV